jgi:catechol 2,3-dioxygenase-like lactoylglutathione lyase family enzyme
MIDHIGILVSNIARATEFYLKALAPLGIGIVREVSTEETGGSPHVAFGRGQKPFFWLRQGLSGPLHIAFGAESQPAVDAFHQAAIRAGGRDNGPPGLRPHYHATYYAAFVLDLDGNNVEAVCHGSPPEASLRTIPVGEAVGIRIRPRHDSTATPLHRGGAPQERSCLGNTGP